MVKFMPNRIWVLPFSSVTGCFSIRRFERATFWPSRFTTRSWVSPGFRLRIRLRSDWVYSLSPSTFRISSPTCSPFSPFRVAYSSKEEITGTTIRWTGREMSIMSRTPTRKFIAAPATRMISLFHQAALSKERGLSLPPSSPSMAQ